MLCLSAVAPSHSRSPNHSNISSLPRRVTDSALESSSRATHFRFSATLQQRGSNRPAQMRPPFTPVQTSASKTPPRRSTRRNIHSKRAQPLRTLRGRANSHRSHPGHPKPIQIPQPVMQPNPEPTRHMVITTPRSPQMNRSRRLKLPRRAARQHAQPLQHSSNLRPSQAVVAMLPLSRHLHEALRLQPAWQVHARRSRTHLRHHRQLRARPRPSIHQAIQNPRPRRLPDRPCNSRNSAIGLSRNIHTFDAKRSILAPQPAYSFHVSRAHHPSRNH